MAKKKVVPQYIGIGFDGDGDPDGDNVFGQTVESVLSDLLEQIDAGPDDDGYEVHVYKLAETHRFAHPKPTWIKVKP